MSSLAITFATISGIILAIPFMIWAVVRFRVKATYKFSPHHRKIVLYSFITCIILSILFFLLAIFI